MKYFLLPLTVLFLFSPTRSLTSLPSTFQTFRVSHSAFTSLSATALSAHKTGDIFLAGTGTLSQRLSTLLRAGPQLFLARVYANGTKRFLAHVPCTGGITRVAAVSVTRNGVFVIGSSDGAVGKSNVVGNGRSEVFVTRFDPESGAIGWTVRSGSGGDDEARAVAADEDGTLYVTGCVRGRLFREMGQVGGVSRVEIGTVDNGRYIGRADADFFVMKVAGRSGKLLGGAQLGLDRDNCGEAIALARGSVFVAVNSFVGGPFDAEGDSVVYELEKGALKIMGVYATGGPKGEFMQDGAIGGEGWFLGGFRTRAGRGLDAGEYFVTKFDTQRRAVAWRQMLGVFRGLEPRVRVGAVGDGVAVSGVVDGVYRREGGDEQLVCMPLVWLDGEGREMGRWRRASPFLEGLVELTGLQVQRDGDLVYAGRFVGDGRSEAVVGSFGLDGVIEGRRGEGAKLDPDDAAVATVS